MAFTYGEAVRLMRSTGVWLDASYVDPGESEVTKNRVVYPHLIHWRESDGSEVVEGWRVTVGLSPGARRSSLSNAGRRREREIERSQPFPEAL
jgi:hypothetical protein